jgi:hypothetical protein
MDDFSIFGGLSWTGAPTIGAGYQDWFVSGSVGGGKFVPSVGNSRYGSLDLKIGGEKVTLKTDIMGLDFDVLEFSDSGVEVPIERTLGRLGIFSNLIDKVQGSDLLQSKKQKLIRDINDAKSLEIVYGTENAEIASGLKTSYVFYELQDQEVRQVAKLEMRSREIVHTTLDVFGLTPGFGEMFDLVNAGIYFSEGGILNGTLSMGCSGVRELCGGFKACKEFRESKKN